MQKSPNTYMFDWYFSPLTHHCDHFTQPPPYRSQGQVTSSEMVRALIGDKGWYRKGERKEESFTTWYQFKAFPIRHECEDCHLKQSLLLLTPGAWKRPRTHPPQWWQEVLFSPELCSTGTSGIAVSNLKPTRWLPDLYEGKFVYLFILFLH